MEYSDKSDIKFMKVVGFATMMIPLFSIAFSVFEYVKNENAFVKQKSFENYHFLISNFNGASSQVSAATIYELKNYPQYCQITLKILASYEATWTDELSLETIKLVKPGIEKDCN
ncbi:hypothetical protein tinsulaeT_00460 [Thalassotalea insulae]|uniref:Uncharacterized protein n=1 Tax=Thalassotalea insulae TaxID=2056778 RepID=A0ABQ6GLI1_9GAMM|nr:hypothetical protein [Thalassotalea insulae]GLX76706.1 hypothetical protein tinsulaeT_00460 [Thalassotalea insulae]